MRFTVKEITSARESARLLNIGIEAYISGSKPGGRGGPTGASLDINMSMNWTGWSDASLVPWPGIWSMIAGCRLPFLHPFQSLRCGLAK